MAIEMTVPAKVPLLELMGCLRWSSPADGRSAQGSEVIDSLLAPAVLRVLDTAASTDLSLRFEQEASRLGYVDATSVMLLGDAGQPARRYQRADADDRRFYQVGGLSFAANARPPHHAWAKVRDFLHQGVDALMASGLPSACAHGPLYGDLRYLDSFDLAGDRWSDLASFLSEAGKIRIGFPDYLTSHLAPGHYAVPSVKVDLPMTDGVLTVEIMQQAIDGEPKILMLSAVRSTAAIACDAASVMAFFDRAHDTIHDLYLDFSAAGS